MIGRVRIDVRRQHGDLARLQRRIEARVVQQRAQLVVQHLHFAQARVAGVHLQAAIVAGRPPARHGARRRAAVQQVALQALQQGVAFGVVGGALFGIGVGGDLAGRMHHFVTAEHAP